MAVFQQAESPAPSAPGGAGPHSGVPETGTPQDGVRHGGAPASAAQAVALVRNGLDWLAAADARELTGAERAEVLRGLAAAESVQLAATSRVLSAFAAAED